MTAIRLWYSPGTCAFAPHILLHETGLAFEPIRTSVRDGAQLTEAFARINPKKRVPVLALDDEIITELPAIATTISLLSPERHLMGKSLLDQARVYEWMNWLSGTVHAQGFGCLWRPQRFTDNEAQYPDITAKGRKTIPDYLATIDQKLDRPHAVGDHFTAVDAFLLVFYRWGNVIGIDMAKTYGNYARFANNLAQRPSVRKTLAAEDIRLEGAT